MKEIFKASYRGIRPAFGYPSLIDQSQMKILFNLLNGEKVTDTAHLVNKEASLYNKYIAGLMNTLKAQAEEVILAELVFS